MLFAGLKLFIFKDCSYKYRVFKTEGASKK